MAKNEYWFHLTHYLFNALLAFALVVGAYFGARWFYYVHLDGYTVPTVVTPIEVLNEDNIVKIGEPILLKIIIDKPEDMRSEVSANITCDDGNLITLATMPTQVPAGKFEVVQDKYVLPPKALIGSKCQFNFIGSYFPNPYAEERVNWSSEVFTVKE